MTRSCTPSTRNRVPTRRTWFRASTTFASPSRRAQRAHLSRKKFVPTFLGYSPTSPPFELTSSRLSQFLLQLATQVNAAPLPPVPEVYGIRLPPQASRLTAPNFSLVPRSAAPPPVEAEEELLGAGLPFNGGGELGGGGTETEATPGGEDEDEDDSDDDLFGSGEDDDEDEEMEDVTAGGPAAMAGAGAKRKSESDLDDDEYDS